MAHRIDLQLIESYLSKGKYRNMRLKDIFGMDRDPALKSLSRKLREPVDSYTDFMSDHTGMVNLLKDLAKQLEKREEIGSPYGPSDLKRFIKKTTEAHAREEGFEVKDRYPPPVLNALTRYLIDVLEHKFDLSFYEESEMPASTL